MMEKIAMLALFPFATGMRMLGVLAIDTIELWEDLKRSPTS